MTDAEIAALPQLLTVAQAAAVLGYHTTTLHTWIRDDACPFPVRRDPGRHIRIAKPALLAWLEQGAAA